MSLPIGLVLAGGLGRRLGRTKGDLSVGGRALAERAATVLSPLCRGTLVSIRPGTSNPAPGYPAVEDQPPAGRGPLAGIDAAFEATEASDLLVLACDYPRIETDLLDRLLARSTAADDLVILAEACGRDHPLVGLWRRRVRGRVREALAQGSYRVRDHLQRWKVRRLGPREFPGVDLDVVLVNVNTLADLEAKRKD